MEIAITSFVKVLADLGLPGVMIAALCFMAYRLYNDGQAKTDVIIQLTRDTVKANETTQSAIVRLSDLISSQRTNGGK